MVLVPGLRVPGAAEKLPGVLLDLLVLRLQLALPFPHPLHRRSVMVPGLSEIGLCMPEITDQGFRHAHVEDICAPAPAGLSVDQLVARVECACLPGEVALEATALQSASLLAVPRSR